MQLLKEGQAYLVREFCILDEIIKIILIHGGEASLQDFGGLSSNS